MPDSPKSDESSLDKSRATVIKGLGVGTQAEKLVKARRENLLEETKTRLEQIEAEGREKADKLIKDAQEQAADILSRANNEAGQIKSKAHIDGVQAGKREVLDKLETLIRTLEEEIHKLQKTRGDFLGNNLPGILEFSCGLSRRILLAELETRPEAVIDRLKALLDRMPSNEGVRILVSSDDLNIIRSHIGELNRPSGILDTALSGDSSVSRGSIIIESDSGRINAPFLEALESMKKNLVEQAENISLSAVNIEGDAG